MLLLKDDYDVTHNFALVDAHTHLRINELEGLVPSEFIRRYSMMVKDLISDISENEGEYRFHFPWTLGQDQIDYYTYCQKDVHSIFHPGEDLSSTLGRYTGFDFIITFSTNLPSRLPRDYRIPNSKVREALIEKSPDDNAPHNNLRFIGFGRVDPNHSDALDAFDNVFQLGLRGLKLHPKEEDFELEGERTIDILKRAAHYNLPVIFHTQEGMASKVEHAVNATIQELLDASQVDMIPRLKVILGHAPWNSVENKELYRTLSHPNIFGELSTIRPESYESFFSDSRSLIKYQRIFEMEPLSDLDREMVEEIYHNAFGYNDLNYWSSKLLFGSDTPYPPSHGSPPLLKHLFSKRFVGNVSDLQNILGVSALKLIPTIAKPNLQVGTEKASTNKSYHPKHLELLKKDSKALGIDPILEVFPKVRINGAIVSFLREGNTESWLFRSLFDAKKPLNMVIPNPCDVSASSILAGKLSISQHIEMSVGEE